VTGAHFSKHFSFAFCTLHRRVSQADGQPHDGTRTFISSCAFASASSLLTCRMISSLRRSLSESACMAGTVWLSCSADESDDERTRRRAGGTSKEVRHVFGRVGLLGVVRECAVVCASASDASGTRSGERDACGTCPRASFSSTASKFLQRHRPWARTSPGPTAALAATPLSLKSRITNCWASRRTPIKTKSRYARMTERSRAAR
jgi:hypothetical protein